MTGEDSAGTESIRRYATMQKNFYEENAKRSWEGVVGSYDFHENLPYETNLLFRNADIRRPLFEDFGKRRAFDIACGEGRMVRRMRRLFGEVDGADISSVMVGLARERTPGSRFWVTDGTNCGDAPSGSYDFVYCTISLQHICVFQTRDLILRDALRLLKPDGKITFQFIYNPYFPYIQSGALHAVDHHNATRPLWRTHHAGWFEDRTTSDTTNSGCDVLFGEGDIPAVTAYFGRYFERVEMWFHDISVGRGGFGRPRTLPDPHPNSHLDDGYWATHFAFIHMDGKRDAPLPG